VTVGRILRAIAVAILCITVGMGFFAPQITHYSYATQFRELPNAAPSAAHLFGTDSLGRDRLTRLVYGTRVSLLLAPATALLSTLLAGVFGSLAGLTGSWCERAILAVADLFIALPLLFVLLALRASIPINLPPLISIIATFVLVGVLGWPSSLRVVWAATRSLRNSDFLLLARASGCGRWRIILRHVLPNLRPILFAQFWISVPVFILTEATLSMLGLGVMEPIPSWGNLLRGLEDFAVVRANPWTLAPLVVLILVVICFQLILPRQEELA